MSLHLQPVDVQLEAFRRDGAERLDREQARRWSIVHERFVSDPLVLVLLVVAIIKTA